MSFSLVSVMTYDSEDDWEPEILYSEILFSAILVFRPGDYLDVFDVDRTG